MGYRTYTCPVARSCGGCEWLAVPYPIQLRRKQEAVERCLGDMAENDGGVIEPIAGMANPCAYRHKCATPFAPGKGGSLRAGFYAAGTHRIVAARSCLAEHPLGRRVINAVAHHAAKLGIPAYREDAGVGCLRHAVVRVGYATDEALLVLVTNGRAFPRAKQLAQALMHEFPQLVGIVQSVNTTRGNAILGRECHTVAGRGTMRDALLGCTFEIGATSFYQTNPAQTETLYRKVIDAAGLENGDMAGGGREGPVHVIDAYCGCGTIGICIAAQAALVGVQAQVIGVERVGAAVAIAQRNANANELGGSCSFVRDDATAYLRRTVGASTRHNLGATPVPSRAGVADGAKTPPDKGFDVVVLDPPRAGSTPEFLAAAATLAPTRIVYVSCNIETQARDLRLLRDSGYRIASVAPVDLFPHTKHVETVVLMSRKDT